MTQSIDTSIYTAVTDAIRSEARRILSDGTVSAVVGYAAARRTGSAQPVVVTGAGDTDKLVFTPACVNNLAVYLTKAKKGTRGEGHVFGSFDEAMFAFENGVVERLTPIRYRYTGLLPTPENGVSDITELIKARYGVFIPGTALFPLSCNQQSLWVLHQLAPESAAYNVAAACRIRGRLERQGFIGGFFDVRRLEDVIQHLARGLHLLLHAPVDLLGHLHQPLPQRRRARPLASQDGKRSARAACMAWWCEDRVPRRGRQSDGTAVHERRS